jgi:hypothetical protein
MESEHHDHQVPIWFFVGGTLLIYGVLILGAGLYALKYHTPVYESLIKANPEASWFFLHPEIWWGGFTTVVGLAYTLCFHPWRKGD